MDTKVGSVKHDVQICIFTTLLGSEAVRKIHALQAQVQKSRIPTETYNKLNELSKLLGKTSSQQQGVVKDLRDKLRILEGNSDADVFRTTLMEAKDKEEEQGELIKDAIERAKELENTAIRVSPKAHGPTFNVLTFLLV